MKKIQFLAALLVLFTSLVFAKDIEEDIRNARYIDSSVTTAKCILAIVQHCSHERLDLFQKLEKSLVTVDNLSADEKLIFDQSYQECSQALSLLGRQERLRLKLSGSLVV